MLGDCSLCRDLADDRAECVGCAATGEARMTRLDAVRTLLSTPCDHADQERIGHAHKPGWDVADPRRMAVTVEVRPRRWQDQANRILRRIS